MKIVVLICFIIILVSISSIILPSDMKCNVENSSWCDNLQTIIKCDAVEYCEDELLQKTWGMCDSCITIVERIRREILMNQTRDSVEIMLEYICIHSQSPSNCLYYLRQNLFTTYSLLKLQVDPRSVCKTLLFCKKQISCSTTNTKQSSYEPNEHYKFILYFNIRELIALSCNLFTLGPDDEQFCYDRLTNNSHIISELIDDHLVYKDYLCSEPKSKFLQLNGCNQCQILMKIIRDDLLNNKTSYEFTFDMKKLCLKVFDGDKRCYDILIELAPVFYEAIKNELFGLIFCIMIKLCHDPANIPSFNLKFKPFKYK